jgi:hypothetical protein
LRPNHQEFAAGVRLAAIAATFAVVTATLVIGVGRTLTPPDEPVATGQPRLARVALR